MAINWKKRTRPDYARFKLKEYPFFVMNQAAARYNDSLAAALSGIGIERPVWRVLMILAESEPAAVGDIADAAVMKRSTITRVIQRMTESGLVATRPSKDDGRITEVTMTKRGRLALAEVKNVASRLFGKAIEDVDSGEIRLLNTILAKIAANLSR